MLPQTIETPAPHAAPGILVAENGDSLHRILEKAFEGGGPRLFPAGDPGEALAAAREYRPDIALIDLDLPGMGGIDLMRRLMEELPHLAAIVVAGGKHERAREAMANGAYDFLATPADAESLRYVLRRARERNALLRENSLLRESLSPPGPFPGFVGHSPAMRGLFDRLAKVAGMGMDLLITGESGTGKELAAETLHHHGRHAGGPLVKVNCAAVPESLIEAELFGLEKGALNGASPLRMGKFERANHGTLFLDEITELSPFMQAKVLRVLQTREVEREGGHAAVGLDFRLIAATNRDIFAAVQEERFRQDLFYRLNVLPLHMAPLRDRSADIIPLALHFIRRYAAKFGKGIVGMDAAARQRLMGYHFPGNVRQLENMVQRAVVLADGPEITAACFQFLDAGEDERNIAPLAEGYGDTSIESAVERAERDQIVRALKASGGRKQAAAAHLKISRKSLYNKMKKYGLLDR